MGKKIAREEVEAECYPHSLIWPSAISAPRWIASKNFATGNSMRKDFIALSVVQFFWCQTALANPTVSQGDLAAAGAAVGKKDDCLLAKARAMDNGTSPSTQVAMAIAPFCHKEEDEARDALNKLSSEDPSAGDVIPVLTEKARLELAREAVETERASKAPQ